MQGTCILTLNSNSIKGRDEGVTKTNCLGDLIKSYKIEVGDLSNIVRKGCGPQVIFFIPLCVMIMW